MTEEDMKKICEEVNIVFHCAACISFTLPYRRMALKNAKATYYMSELCKRVKKLDILVYTSTAYANAHVSQQQKIEEKVYALPYSVQTFLDEMDNGSDESFDGLVSTLESKWNMKWPNSYTFSKCLAENILLEKASDLPVCIVRPSIVYSAFRGTLPGYLEDGSLMSDLTQAIGKGIMQVFHTDGKVKIETIPVDIVANSHILAAPLVATGRCPSIFVLHCCLGDKVDLRMGDCMADIADILRRNQIPNGFQKASVTVAKSKLMYSLLTFYHHYIPAAVLDLYFAYKGYKHRLWPLCQMVDDKMQQVHHFTSNTFIFQTDNFYSLSSELQPEEKEMFYIDVGKCGSFKELFRNLPNRADIYDWDLDKLGPKKRQQIVHKHTMMISAIKRFTLLLAILALYFSLSKLFF